MWGPALARGIQARPGPWPVWCRRLQPEPGPKPDTLFISLFSSAQQQLSLSAVHLRSDKNKPIRSQEHSKTHITTCAAFFVYRLHALLASPAMTILLLASGYLTQSTSFQTSWANTQQIVDLCMMAVVVK